MLQNNPAACNLNLMYPVTLYQEVWELTFVPDQPPLPTCLPALPSMALPARLQLRMHSLNVPSGSDPTLRIAMLTGIRRQGPLAGVIMFLPRTKGLNFASVNFSEAPGHFRVAILI